METSIIWLITLKVWMIKLFFLVDYTVNFMELYLFGWFNDYTVNFMENSIIWVIAMFIDKTMYLD